MSGNSNSKPIKMKKQHTLTDIPPKKESIYFMMRHSERCDLVYNKKENDKVIDHEDSPITTRGEKMAELTGNFIRNSIRQLKHDGTINKNVTPVIISSPYLRCLQTAKNVINGLNTPIHKNTIFIEDGCQERQDIKRYLKTGQNQVLTYDKLTDSEKQKFFEGNYKWEDNAYLDYDKYPQLKRNNYEAPQEYFERFNYLYENLAELAYEFRDTYIFIVVSHSDVLKVFNQCYLNRKSTPDYCAANIFYNEWVDKHCKNGKIEKRINKSLIVKNYYAYKDNQKHKLDSLL